MGKKVKKKSRTPQKENRVPSSTQKRSSEPSKESSVETVDEAVSAAKEKNSCSHLGKGVNLDALSAKLGSAQTVRCEDCREGAADRRGGKGKGKHGKKKGSGSADSKSESRAIWVCLACGHYACGGVGLPTSPQCHALRHARQTRHPIVLQLENPHLRWCFPCNTLIQAEKVEENGDQKDIFLDVMKVLKGCTASGTTDNAEDVLLRTGNVTTEINSVVSASNNLDRQGGYVPRGLLNLGNTCFFNSVLQNLLAMNKLRDYFFKLDVSVGPLTMALKKIFIETQPEAGLKNVINPRAFFGSVCSKAPQFRGYQQHDSHELLRCLLDGLSSEELAMLKHMNSSKENGNSSSPTPTFVDAVFGGQVSSTVCCLECGHSSTVYEPYLDLSLPVPTKKPTTKKTQQSARSKKPKLPPKRLAKNRPKLNRGVESVLDASTSKELPCQSQSGSAGPPTMPEESCSFVQNSSPAVGCENKFSSPAEGCENKSSSPAEGCENQPSAPAEECENQASAPAEECENQPSVPPEEWENKLSAPGEECESKQTYDDAVEQTSFLFDDFTWMDYIEPEAPSEDYELTANNTIATVVQDLNNKDMLLNDVLGQSGTEFDVQVLPLNEEADTKPQFPSINPWEDELPALVQSSEVLLLPYKEEDSTAAEFEAETSSTIHGAGQEDFDGFGGLFDEPEVSSGPISGPSLSNEVSETGFMAMNSSESDPDEVDNSDSPVSVETCLAHFTKPETLSNENAWHCENCSKIFLRQKLEDNKQSKVAYKNLVNGYRTGTQSDLASVNKDPCPKEAINDNDNIQSLASSNKPDVAPHCSSENHTVKENVQTDEPTPFDPQGEEDKAVIKDAIQEQSNSSGTYYTSRQESLSDNATDSGCAGERSSYGSIADRVQEGEPNPTENHESEESEDDEISSKTIKVKRDATKRVLINKSPPILTIHLKRFSQDTRGRLSKLNGHVTFKEMIDLKPYIDSRCVDDERYDYRLIGVVEHQGTMRGGHYVSYVRGTIVKENDVGSVWFHVSDAYVRETNLEEVLRCEAYILFYEKV